MTGFHKPMAQLSMVELLVSYGVTKCGRVFNQLTGFQKAMA